MSQIGGWDIDSYRSFYESDEHWTLKKEFLEAHYDSIPEDRLICLAQVYVNIELLGCRYPQKVVEEVKYLSSDLGLNYKEKKKTKLQRTFVKASDAAGAKVRGSKGEKRKLTDNYNPKQPLQKKMMSFVKAQEEDPIVKTQEEDPNPFLPHNILSFIKAARDDNPNDPVNEDNEKQPFIDEASGQHQQTADKCLNLIKSMRGEVEHPGGNPGIRSPLIDQRGLIDKYKKAAQQNSRQKITFDLEPNYESQTGRGIGRGNFRSPRGRSTSVSGQSMNKRLSTQQLEAFMRSNDPLSEFILVQRVYANCDIPASILQQSATFSHMPLDWTYDQSGMRCTVSINGMHIATARGDGRKAAKDAVAVKALEVLIKRCYCLRILKLHSSSDEVSVAEVSGSKVGSSTMAPTVAADLDTPIEDTSIGSKLLKMMGWTGGGLGKDGGGISEPIKPSQIFDRRGLGHEGEQGVTKMFRQKIRGMIQNYVHSNDRNDLAFSPLFSKEQRAEIHKIARQFKLRSHSHGKGENRFLILSRKFSPKQLIYQLLQEGSTDKYELIPPEKN